MCPRLQHRPRSQYTAEFQVACDAFGVGVYDSDYQVLDQPSGSIATDHKIEAVPRINAQDHRTPPGILDITQHSENKADTNSAWVPSQTSKNGTKPAHDQQDTQTSSQTLIDRSGKTRRSRSVANPIRAPDATPRGSTGASNRGSTVKPTWRVKNANTKEVAPCNAAEPNTHGVHRHIPPRPTPAAPTTNHSRHATLEKPERDNTTNQDACHDTRRDAQQHGLKQEPVSTAPDIVSVDLCPHISNASIAAMQPHHIKDFIHSAIDPHLHQLLSERNELEHIHHIRQAIGAMDTCDTVSIIRSAARLHEIVNNSIAAEAREIPSVSEVDDEPQAPRPIGGDTINEGRVQTSAIDQPHIDAPCPYTWAERYLGDHQSRKLGTHMVDERQLDHVYTNIAQAVDDITNNISTHHPIGMGPKHLKHQMHQEEYHKGNEQHVPQFIVEILSFMAMATCQFTSSARSRNSKDFLVLLDMVERLHDTNPNNNCGEYQCCGHCIDDCLTGQWVVLLSCGHVHHHVCHHAATRNKVFHTCPSCGKTRPLPRPRYKLGAPRHEDQRYCVWEPDQTQFSI